MIVLDANVIINAHNPTQTNLRSRIESAPDQLACSDMVRLEVLGYVGLLTQERSELINFFSHILILPVTTAVIDTAIQLRQNSRIRSPDAIIAATALLNDTELWSSNTSDFVKITGLKLYDPMSKQTKC